MAYCFSETAASKLSFLFLYALSLSPCLYLSHLSHCDPRSLSVANSHWASRTERCLFLVSCWLHPPGGLSCFVAMQDTWLELAWQRCHGHCASSITDPILHWEKWRWPKKAQHFHLKVPPGGNLDNHLCSGLSDMLFCIFIFCVNIMQDTTKWLGIFKAADLSS